MDDACFWWHPAIRVVDDCVPPVDMLNLKTANLVGQPWGAPYTSATVAPAPFPDSPDTQHDLGQVLLLVGKRSFGLANKHFGFKLPLRNVGGAFTIGSNSYPRPLTSAVYLFVEFSMGTNFGWFDFVSPTPATEGYLNSTIKFINGAGTVVQTNAWCDMQARSYSGYSSNVKGQFDTGQGTGPPGSFINYVDLRAVLPLSPPATDFDNGWLEFTVDASDTDYTGGNAGAPLAGDEVGFPSLAYVKLLSISSPAIDQNWSL